MLLFSIIISIALYNISSPGIQTNPDLVFRDDPGESLYKSFCADCHGKDMEAFLDWDWTYGKDEKAIRQSIVEGRDFGAMPAFGDTLNESQIRDLVSYLNAGLEKLATRPPAVEMDMSKVYQAKDFNYRLETVVSGIRSPWGMAFMKIGSILVTEKSGQLFIVNPNGSKKEIFQTPEVNSGGQGGLMDVALHPDYDKNGWIYLSYSITKEEGGRKVNTTAVSRYRLKSNLLVDGELIFEGLPYSSTRHHYGSRLIFDNDGYLYVTIGDRGARDVNPQRLDLYPGKTHRINDDGTIPPDNPFVDHPNAVKSIYSYGHRNAQGMALHPVTGAIWVHEHGPRGGDELNLVKKGANFGWPLLSYGINYNGTTFTHRKTGEGYNSPIHYWVPSIAPSGMTFIRGDKYPGWKGHLLLGSLKFEYLDLCKMSGNQVVSEEKIMDGIGRVRDVKQAPDGYIYVSVEEPGKVFRIIPLK